MLFNLVDRAGMGVLRMGVKSLIYGRRYPQFREASGSVEVTMHAEHLRPEIFVITQTDDAEYGIPELVILNDVYETGVVKVTDIEDKLQKVKADPWESILESLNIGDMGQFVELCGTNDGIFIRVKSGYKKYFKVTRTFRTAANSDKHVRLYKHLKRYREDNNENIRVLLGYSHGSSTSQFLRNAKYVLSRGGGRSSRWYLV